jgi:hypothetical protein
MAEASSITSSDLAAVTAGATACDHLTELANTRTKFATFLDWIVSDPSGSLATDFKTAVINQLLFDAAKKGYLVMSDVTTGYLALVEKLLLTKLDQGSAATGDLLRWNGTNWAKSTPFYGGSGTVPSVATGGSVAAAHGLSAAPTFFSCYLVCNDVGGDAGYAQNDRIRADTLMYYNSGAPELIQACTVQADATSVRAVFRNGGGAHAYQVHNKSTFARASITESKWDVKFAAM